MLYNFFVGEIKRGGFTPISVTVVGTRFAKQSTNVNAIITTVTDLNGRVMQKVTPFALIKSHTLKLRSVLEYLPFSRVITNKIIESISLRASKVEFVRYDVESGTLIVNVPNNPSVQNTAFVTRNLNTRMSENVSFRVDSLKAALLLMVFNRYYNIILNDELLTNMF